jgi:ribosome-binding factor A
MPHRIEKIDNLMQEILAQTIAKDFCVSREVIISLTRVVASGNLQEAKVYISVLPDRERENIVSALNKKVIFFQNILNKKMRTRPVPRIIFVSDTKPEEAQKVEQILEQIKENETL